MNFGQGPGGGSSSGRSVADCWSGTSIVAGWLPGPVLVEGHEIPFEDGVLVSLRGVVGMESGRGGMVWLIPYL